jgi:tetratricopeptide (TPR) repeat protein
MNRGIVKGKMKSYNEAILDFNSALKINQQNGNAYYNRGYALILSGKNMEGCNDLSKAGELGYFKAYELIKEHCKTL